MISKPAWIDESWVGYPCLKRGTIDNSDSWWSAELRGLLVRSHYQTSDFGSILPSLLVKIQSWSSSPWTLNLKRWFLGRSPLYPSQWFLQDLSSHGSFFLVSLALWRPCCSWPALMHQPHQLSTDLLQVYWNHTVKQVFCPLNHKVQTPSACSDFLPTS